ncbi:efflux RND transporter permease subunit [Mesorhizobium neociceri]|uniref:Efflux RND transporter permease subunit n=1 Tax=Mesorhizobium neociceri TaxID=1307853 RepID=A0A838BCA8_9HYPH|nr:efflux RND transporter permease subunit [Mesorhizobium neociceri]MBA1144298.1 efflux RND transporter permease subunit [Mesorhizobium neociceri]
MAQCRLLAYWCAGHRGQDLILLVEYALVAEKERKMSRFEALLDAARKRAQPTAMTFRLP